MTRLRPSTLALIGLGLVTVGVGGYLAAAAGAEFFRQPALLFGLRWMCVGGTVLMALSWGLAGREKRERARIARQEAANREEG